MPITRYNFERTRKHEWIVMKHDKGPWVTFEDHYTVVRDLEQAKDARIKELEEELKSERQATDGAGDLVAECNIDMLDQDKRIEELKQELARVNLSYDVDMRAWKERIEDLEKQIAENR